MKNDQLLIVITGISLFLGGCTSLSRSLGFEKNPPDEFKVVKGNALTMPPNFSLKPPKKKDLAAKRAEAAQSAHAIMIKSEDGIDKQQDQRNEEDVKVRDLDPGSEALVLGAKKKLSNNEETRGIRQKVDDEAGVYTEPDSDSVANKVLKFLKNTNKQEETINPEEEKKRYSTKKEEKGKE